MENKVLATVNGKEITEQDLNYMLEKLGPERAAQFNNAMGKVSLVYELVNQEVLLQNAVAEGFDQEEDFKNEMETIRVDLLKSYAIQKLIGDVEATAEDAKTYYDENQGEFQSGESVQASHILVASLAEALEAKERIKAGEDFGTVAGELSSCPSGQNGGDLGFFTKGQMVPEFEEAAFSLPQGEVSEPVETQFGYHLITVTAKEESRMIPFEEVAAHLVQNLTAVKRNEEYAKRCSEIRAKYDISIKE